MRIALTPLDPRLPGRLKRAQRVLHMLIMQPPMRHDDRPFGHNLSILAGAGCHAHVLVGMFYMPRIAYIRFDICLLKSLASSFSRIARLLSWCCLPCAIPNSTFTIPFLKYIASGISVVPFCCVALSNFLISLLCTSS